MGFLAESGGAYAQHDTGTCRDIIDALFDNRFRITRHPDGTIKSVTTWWMIHEKDMDEVARGGKPADISTGPIVYVADHAGPGITKMISFFRTISDWGCWHHRYKQPEQFRQYRSRT